MPLIWKEVQVSIQSNDLQTWTEKPYLAFTIMGLCLRTSIRYKEEQVSEQVLYAKVKLKGADCK